MPGLNLRMAVKVSGSRVMVPILSKADKVLENFEVWRRRNWASITGSSGGTMALARFTN